MLCVNQYPKQHIQNCRARFSEHVAAYQKLSSAVSAEGDAKSESHSRTEGF
jgi:hypothetical protein